MLYFVVFSNFDHPMYHLRPSIIIATSSDFYVRSSYPGSPDRLFSLLPYTRTIRAFCTVIIALILQPYVHDIRCTDAFALGITDKCNRTAQDATTINNGVVLPSHSSAK